MPDDYTKEPITLTEYRATSQGQGKLWSVRDALVNTLRRIDAGEFVPMNMALVIETEEAYIDVIATPDEDKTLALFTRGIYQRFRP